MIILYTACHNSDNLVSPFILPVCAIMQTLTRVLILTSYLCCAARVLYYDTDIKISTLERLQRFRLVHTIHHHFLLILT